MKKKIVAYLALLFLFFTTGAVMSMFYIAFTTAELKRVIKLQSIEILRQDLIIKIQNVKQDLLTVNTEFGSTLDAIVANVSDLNVAVENCAGCHRDDAISKNIGALKERAGRFEATLSSYITASADEGRIRALKAEAYTTGNDLLRLAADMAFLASQRLQERTQQAIGDVRRAQQILLGTLCATFFMALWIAATLTRKTIGPIRELIGVSRKIAAGNLGFTTPFRDATEFGELATSLNDMSLSLKESNEKVVHNLNRLAGLYRVTVPLHSATNIREFFREVSFGVADLVEVEQSGILLLDEKHQFFEHKFPAYGLSEQQAGGIRVPGEKVKGLFSAAGRRPLIVNVIEEGQVLDEFIGGPELQVRNLLLGWVRQKGELVGVIRLANRNGDGFDEESARLLGIISNNVSVAIENIRLYENIKLQMVELKQAQEQLIQAAKLAAIGELASNVAHEINNPLTSILGYAELIKEEHDIDCIMRDVGIIESESHRAKEIVRQLLEFSRKRQLEIREVDLNRLLRETTSLMHMQLKDGRIRLLDDYGDLPGIMGDPNQLKQVFLNVLSNAVDSFAGESGEIRIRTSRKDSTVLVEIEDNGHGIPDDVLPRIFEPFFTTKREKGTGLGLSVSYKIIEGHHGRIDVRSAVGKGSRFIIALPIRVPA